MTCATCAAVLARPGPLCDDCAAERAEHRAAKARYRAERARARHEKDESR